MVEQVQQSKLVLLGEMSCGKTSLVQRFVRGQFFENQVGNLVERWCFLPVLRHAASHAVA